MHESILGSESPPSHGRWAGAVVRRFLRSQTGRPEEEPNDVFKFLEAEPDLEPTEVVAVLRADQRSRSRAGTRPDAEWYFEQFPEALTDPELALDLIYSEFLLREADGESPEVEEYLGRFPGYAQRIRVQAAFHRALESTRPGSIDPPPRAEPERPALASAPGHPNFPTIPGYQLIRELGTGGMGVVYEAYQLGLKRRVALKMVLAGPRTGPERDARFQKEAEAAASLHHPNIAEIHEIGEFEGRPYFTLELVEGGDLARELAAGPVSPRRAAKLTEALARAMHYAHQHGIIHRDLKPSNVLLTPEGSPKVADFGLAKHLKEDSDQTQSGTVLGSPCYMSPEQASGRVREVGPEADVYSMGAILYEMLAGAPPFRADTPLETLRKLLNEDPIRPSRLHLRVPRDLETICLKCLERHPRRRYPTAIELAEDLARFLDYDSIRARPVAIPERIWRWCRRKTSLAFAAGLAALAIASTIGLSISLAVQHYQAKSQQDRADQEIQSRRQQVDQMAADLSFDHGQALCEQGDIAHGLLWLTRGLLVAEHAHDPRLERVFRKNLAAWWDRIHALRVRWEHPGSIQSVAYSPDGRLVATSSDDRTVRFWVASTGEPTGIVLHHPGTVHAIAFSPDGRTLASGSDDAFGRLWDVKTGSPTGLTLSHPSSILGIAFSPDGQVLLTTGTDQTARLWDAETGQPIGQPMKHQGAVNSGVFSPDGQLVLTGGSDRTARLWSARSGLSVGRQMFHDDWVSSVAFSPDGQTLLTGSHDRSARLWDRQTGRPVGPPILHPHSVGVVAFAPDGKRVATGSNDGTARIWDVATGQAVGPFLRHQHAVSGLAFSPDGHRILTGGYDSSARIWEIALSSKHLFAEAGFLPGVTLSSDGRTILSAGQDDQDRSWNPARGEPIGPALHHGAAVESVVFASGGRALLTGSLDATARLWDPSTLTPLGPPLRHASSVRSVAISPDDRIILTGSDDKTARLWDAATGHPIGQPMTHEGSVRSVAFSPDGQTILTGSDDKMARLWRTSDGSPRLQPLIHRGKVLAVVYSPDGLTFMTGSDDMEAKLWDAETGEVRGKPLRHDGPVSIVAFSPDSRVAMTGGWDRTARLWDVATGATIAPPLRHDGHLRTLAISPDGQAVLTGTYNRTSQLWDKFTGKPIGPPSHHETQVWFVPNNNPDPKASDRLRLRDPDRSRIARVMTLPSPTLREKIQIETGMELRDDGSLHVLSLDEWDGLHVR